MSPMEGYFIREFARAILHGDADHRQWLLDAAEAFIEGRPIPRQGERDGTAK
jgi:hypothetical protein